MFRKRDLFSHKFLLFLVFLLFILTSTIFYIFLELNQPHLTFEDTKYGKKKPYIFIGGFPRSGTTLMRVILDVHQDVSCGPETHVSPKIASMGYNMMKSENMKYRLRGAKIWPDAFFRAFRAFFYEIIEATTDKTTIYNCIKDPFLLGSSEFLSQIFPNAKFILMIRDGRAVTASIIKRSVGIKSISSDNPQEVLKKWDNSTKHMVEQCYRIGNLSCFVLRYEDLVLRPRESTTRLANFLGISWTEDFLNHDKLMTNHTYMNPFEMSNTQVVYPINLEAIYSWSREGTVLPQDLLNVRTAMLERFSYWPNSIPPNYGDPEPEVLEKYNKLMYDKKASIEFSPGMKPKRNFFDIVKLFEQNNS